MTYVKLSANEFARAAFHAVYKLHASIRDQRTASRSQTGRSLFERLAHDVRGAVAEAAVAKFLGKPYQPTADTFHELPDAHGLDVRSVDSDEPGQSLIVRDDDPDPRPVVLAVVNKNAAGDEPRECVVELAGWMTYGEAKRPEWRRDPHGRRPAWFVPRSALRPVLELDGGTDGR